MGVELFGDWKKAADTLNGLDKRFKRAAHQAMLQEGQFLRAKIIEGLREQAPGGEAFSPLSQYTIAVRRFQRFQGTKALIRRADLRNSVVAVKATSGEGVFVGVLRTAKGADGKPTVNIAEQNEFGFGPIVVPITPKSRRFFHAALEKAGIEMPHSGPSGGGAAIAIIRTPARPFMRPPFDKYMKPAEVRVRFYGRMVTLMAGQLGTP